VPAEINGKKSNDDDGQSTSMSCQVREFEKRGNGKSTMITIQRNLLIG